MYFGRTDIGRANRVQECLKELMFKRINCVETSKKNVAVQNLRVQVQSAVQYTFYIVYTVIDFLRICSFFFTMHVEHKHPHHRRLFARSALERIKATILRATKSLLILVRTTFG